VPDLGPAELGGEKVLRKCGAEKAKAAPAVRIVAGSQPNFDYMYRQIKKPDARCIRIDTFEARLLRSEVTHFFYSELNLYQR
jgi:hypothetical protein